MTAKTAIEATTSVVSFAVRIELILVCDVLSFVIFV